MNGLGKSRKKAGMTQKKASELSGIPLGTLRNWEQGIYEPDSKSLVRLAGLYDCTTDDLLDSPFSSFNKADTPPAKISGTHAVNDEHVYSIGALTNDEMQLVEMYRQCTPSRREMLLSMARDARDASIRKEEDSESFDKAVNE